MTLIANIHAVGPAYVTSPEGYPAERANTALAQYLGNAPLTPALLQQIIEVGVQTLARSDADALALGIHDARRALSEEMATVRAAVAADHDRLSKLAVSSREGLAEAVSRSAGEAQKLVNTAMESTQRVIAALPETARQQLAPHIEAFRESLTAEASKIMDPTNGSAGASLHRSVQETLDRHFDRIGDKFSELETKIGIAEARDEEREFSNRKGFDFEDDLEELLAQWCSRSGLVVRATGTKTGYVKRSTKGDFVIFTEDGETPLVAIEAKNRIEGTGVAEKHRDMDEMLRNRGCSVGLWVTKGRVQNKGEILTSLSASRWSFAVEDDTEGLFEALLTLAVATARRGVTDSAGDVETARHRIQDALTAAADLDTLQRDAQAVVKAADTLNERTVKLRTRIHQALMDAAAALSSDKDAGTDATDAAEPSGDAS